MVLPTMWEASGATILFCIVAALFIIIFMLLDRKGSSAQKFMDREQRIRQAYLESLQKRRNQLEQKFVARFKIDPDPGSVEERYNRLKVLGRQVTLHTANCDAGTFEYWTMDDDVVTSLGDMARVLQETQWKVRPQCEHR